MFKFIILLAFPFILLGQNNRKISIYFDSNHSDLTIQENQKLLTFLKDIEELPVTQIETWAYTDEDGNWAYNIDLAKNRINTVESLFQKSISVVYKSHPKSELSGKDDELKRNNRRVDIIATIAPLETPQDLANYYLEKERQIFYIKADSFASFKGKQGTSFEILPNSLVFEDGSLPKGNIEVTLNEAFDESDWMLYGLQTMSDERVLRTGGMFNLTASSNGKPLQLQRGKLIKTTLPIEKLDTSMKIFEGERLNSGVINWKATTQVLAKKNVQYCLSLNTLTINEIQTVKVPKLSKPVLNASNKNALKARVPEIKVYPPSLPRMQKLEKWRALIPFHIGEKKAMKAIQKEYNREMVKYRTDSSRYQRHLSKFKKAIAAYEKDSVSRKEIRQYLNQLQLYYACFNIKVLQKTLKDKPNISEKDIAILNDKILKKAQREFSREFLKYTNKEDDLSLDEARIKNDSLIKMDCYEYKPSPINGLATIYKLAYSDTLINEINNVVSLNKLGWINCDAFGNSNENKMQVQVDESERNARINFFVPRKNSLLPVLYYNGIFISPLIPKSIYGIFVGVKVKEGKTYFAKKKFFGDEEKTVSLTYKEIALADLRNEFNTLKE